MEAPTGKVYTSLSDATSRRMEHEPPEDDGLFHLYLEMLIRTSAFAKAGVLSGIKDVGCPNIEVYGKE